ncbi:MAG: Gfo/Idh/MocA family oxidoreductase [Bacteroidota bacterium]|nr:Gfo/Idh/MocA family oxidoreductase [Bacteroidota bacterium]MDW8224442.1 Gfo/Idh/MocA family oxidoreductase [Bacteroidota bacterium]
MERFGIALVGVGNIAQSIHLPLLKRLPGVNLVAVCDRVGSKARLVAERFGIPYATNRLDDLWHLEGIDVIDICTTTDVHPEIACAALEHGKHAFVEKPLARTLAEAQHVAEIAARSGRHLMVGMNHRFRPDVTLLRSYVGRGELGRIYYIKAGWLQPRQKEQRWLTRTDISGGGVLIDLGIVLLDLVLWMYDFAPVRSVHAALFRHQTRVVEDLAVATLYFANGSIATLECSWSLVRPENLYYCNLFGTRGSGYINPFRVVRQTDGGEFLTIHAEGQACLPSAQQYTHSYVAEWQYFLNMLRGHVPPLSTAQEAVHRMRVLEALYRSGEEQQEIFLST